jgi:hypothetical protein
MNGVLSGENPRDLCRVDNHFSWQVLRKRERDNEFLWHLIIPQEIKLLKFQMCLSDYLL